MKDFDFRGIIVRGILWLAVALFIPVFFMFASIIGFDFQRVREKPETVLYILAVVIVAWCFKKASEDLEW